MSTTRPFTGERSSRPVPLAADAYASCRFRFGSCDGTATISPRPVSRAARPGPSAVFCTGLDEPDGVSSPDDSVATFASCRFDTSFACRGLETISEAARPNDPAVSKEADKTAVTGSHLFGSIMNGFGRNLSLSISSHTSNPAWKNLRCEHRGLQYRRFDESTCCPLRKSDIGTVALVRPRCCLVRKNLTLYISWQMAVERCDCCSDAVFCLHFRGKHLGCRSCLRLQTLDDGAAQVFDRQRAVWDGLRPCTSGSYHVAPEGLTVNHQHGYFISSRKWVTYSPKKGTINVGVPLASPQAVVPAPPW